MDKYTYNIKADKIQKLVKKGDFEAAVRIADTVDWEEVHSVRLLTITAAAYENTKDYKSAIELLQMAYEESAVGKRILYKLTGLAIAMGDVELAQHYYEMYLQEASDDNGRYLLRYLLAELKKEPLDKRIAILETYRKYEFEEEWALRLAQMYDEAGMGDECVKLCDEIILWFGVGDYVDEAMALKEKYAPLSEEQKEHRDNKEFYEQRYQEVVNEYNSREEALIKREEEEKDPEAAAQKEEEAWSRQILLVEAETLEEAVPKALERVAIYYRAKGMPMGKISRISAERFNEVGFEAARSRLAGRDLLIDDASALSEDLLSDIVHSVKYEKNPQLFILTDKPDQLAYLDTRLGEFIENDVLVPQIEVSEPHAEDVLMHVSETVEDELSEQKKAKEESGAEQLELQFDMPAVPDQQDWAQAAEAAKMTEELPKIEVKETAEEVKTEAPAEEAPKAEEAASEAAETEAPAEEKEPVKEEALAEELPAKEETPAEELPAKEEAKAEETPAKAEEAAGPAETVKAEESTEAAVKEEASAEPETPFIELIPAVEKAEGEAVTESAPAAEEAKAAEAEEKKEEKEDPDQAFLAAAVQAAVAGLVGKDVEVPAKENTFPDENDLSGLNDLGDGVQWTFDDFLRDQKAAHEATKAPAPVEEVVVKEEKKEEIWAPFVGIFDQDEEPKTETKEAAKAPAPVKEAPAELAATKVVPSEKIREAVKAQDEDLATVLAAKMKAAEKEAEKEAAKVSEDETIVVKKVQAAVAEEKKEEKKLEGETKTVKKLSTATGKIGAIGMSEEAFVEYAKNYLTSIDCVLDDAGELALQNAAESRRESGILLSKEEAENMIEEAADLAEKKGGLFVRRYDKDGCLILRSKYIK